MYLENIEHLIRQRDPEPRSPPLQRIQCHAQGALVGLAVQYSTQLSRYLAEQGQSVCARYW